jgi:hypothetical protein
MATSTLTRLDRLERGHGDAGDPLCRRHYAVHRAGTPPPDPWCAVCAKPRLIVVVHRVAGRGPDDR